MRKYETRDQQTHRLDGRRVLTSVLESSLTWMMKKSEISTLVTSSFQTKVNITKFNDFLVNLSIYTRVANKKNSLI